MAQTATRRATPRTSASQKRYAQKLIGLDESEGSVPNAVRQAGEVFAT
jgi:hypothetical protein